MLKLLYTVVILCCLQIIFTQATEKANKCDIILDLTFIIDSSGSVTPYEFQQAKLYVDRLVKRLNVEPTFQEAHVGIISFAESAYTYQVYVPNSQYIDMLSNRVKSLPYLGRSTALTKALNDAKEKIFKENRGQFTPRIVVLLTDGSGNEKPDEIKLEAKKLKEDSNVHLFVIGIGKQIKYDMLESMASEPKDFYVKSSNSFHALMQSINNLTQASCNVNGFDY